MSLKDIKEFSILPEEAIQLFEQAYHEILDIDKDNWQEAKEFAEKRILASKYGDLYAGAMLRYIANNRFP